MFMSFLKKNKPIKKIIEKGKISESIVEILKGLTQKTRVLKNKPSH